MGNKLNRKKLDKLRRGPYKIIERISNSVYKVNLARRGRNFTLFHIRKLLPYHHNSMQDPGGEGRCKFEIGAKLITQAALSMDIWT